MAMSFRAPNMIAAKFGALSGGPAPSLRPDRLAGIAHHSLASSRHSDGSILLPPPLCHFDLPPLRYLIAFPGIAVAYFLSLAVVLIRRFSR